MLRCLSITNYALIASLSVDFDGGFSVITGETGAGKSILLGALSFVLGDRADTSVLLNEEKKCVVEAIFTFDNERLKPFFEQNDIDFDTDCVIRRELNPQKKTRAFINDTPVTSQVLKDLGRQLIDIHSQHDSLLLTDDTFQLGLLDDAAKNNQILNEYQIQYQAYNLCSNELKRLREKSESNQSENDFLKFQLDELTKAQLQDNEYEEVSQRLELLENAEEVQNLLSESNVILDSGEPSLLDQLNDLKANLERLKKFMPEAGEMCGRVEVTRIELKDISRDLERLQDETQFDASSLETLQERYDLIQRLMMKHHVNEYEQLLQIREDISHKVNDFANIDEVIAKKENELHLIEKELKRLAASLNKRRLATIKVFENEVTEIIHQLAMPHGVFKIQCETLPQFTATGTDKVCFLFSANKGVAVDDMSRVASGGELSRLMLAIKSVAANNNYIPTLIFDEIDTGVSGEVASKLGNIMQKMGETLQLISITHLPQIASKARHHFFVYKDETEAQTRSCIKPLSEEERIREIAKMLSNDEITEEALKAAGVLLKVR